MKIFGYLQDVAVPDTTTKAADTKAAGTTAAAVVHGTTAAADVTVATTLNVADPVATENKAAIENAVQPAGDVSEPTSTPDSGYKLELDDGSSSLSSFILFVVVVSGGVAFWRLGGLRYAKLLFSGSERARYRKVSSSDLEK